MSRRIRHDAILRTLRRNSASTIDELAEEADVSRRTILRDISALRDEGYIIHSDVGRGGGLSLDPGSIQTTPRLSVPEVFALLISVSTMRVAGNLPFSDIADSGLIKLEKSLPPDKVKDLRRFLECIHIGQLSSKQNLSDVGKLDDDLLTVFEIAFLQRQILQFRYRDTKGFISERTVEPHAMLILTPLWYLVAWDPMRDNFRHFRMDRITRPRNIENTKFRPRKVPFDKDVCPFSELTHR